MADYTLITPNLTSIEGSKPTFGLDTDTDILKLLRANGIYTRADMSHFDSFYRYPRLDPFNRLNKTSEYVFFTKPDLHLFKDATTSILNPELANMPFFADLLRRGYSPVMQELQYSANASCPFMRVLTNNRLSNLDLPAISVEDVDTSANLYGTKMFYRKASDHTDEEHDFSLEFSDSKYLEVYLLFKIFDEYERKKYYGKITPPNDSYTINKILHDQISIYKFIVGEDDETIIHFSKLYGCYPKSVPRESFSELSADGELKFTVNWKCTFVEDMEPNILTDFNTLTADLGGTDIPIWDSSINAVSGENVKMPYIVAADAALGKYSMYRLKWKA